MVLGPDDLVLSHMSVTRASRAPDSGATSPTVGASFEERCAAAAAGGFAGFGITAPVYDRERSLGRSDADLRAMLRSFGVLLAELDCFAIPGRFQHHELRKKLDHLLQIADVFEVSRMFFYGSPWARQEELAEVFGWVCDRCAEYNIKAGVEFIKIDSSSSLPTADAALQVVRAVGRDNAGLVIDVYHHVNGAYDWDQLERVPGEAVVGIQLTDCAIPRKAPSYIEDTLHHRRAPGEGDADLIRFVRTMDEIGASCPYSVEVISDEIVALEPERLGDRLGTSSRRVLQNARACPRDR